MMEAQTQEVRSPGNDNQLTKEDVLKLIIAREIKPIFLRPHLDAEQLWAFLAGFIGDRGAGKSASCAVVSIIDHMVSKRKVFSNMKISCDIQVDDDTARSYGLNSGGLTHYKALPLDKDALLNLDERYERACLVIEEINVEYSNVRRAMTNTNVDFNQVAQQLRHFETSLLYNVIDEMFIDPQLRSLTDVFVKSYDTAFDADSLDAQKPRGIDFRWDIYPMSGYLRGNQGKFNVTKKTMPPVYLHFAPWRGSYDTMQKQRKGIYSISTKDKNRKLMAKFETESSPEVTGHFEKWDWLVDMIKNWKSQGINFMKPGQMANIIGRPLDKELRKVLPVWGVIWDANLQGYIISDYELEAETVTT